MKRFLKRILPMMLAMAMLFSLAACGNKADDQAGGGNSQAPANSNAPQGGSSSDGDITIRITWWGGESRL